MSPSAAHNKEGCRKERLRLARTDPENRFAPKCGACRHVGYGGGALRCFIDGREAGLACRNFEEVRG